MATTDLSQYGLTATADGTGASFDFDASGVIESHEPGFVKALESASEQISGVTAGAVAALDTAAEVASYVAPDVAAAISGVAADASAAAASALTGPLAPVVAALIVALAVVEGNLAHGGTGCCGERPFTRAEAAHQWLFEHGHINLFTGQQVDSYKPTDADLKTLLLYSGYGATAAPCNSAHYSWDVSWGAADDPGTNNKATKFLLTRPKGSPEAFVEGVMRAAWEAKSGCWSWLDPKSLPAIMAGAVRAWNNTHMPSSKRVVIISPLDGMTLANPMIVAADQLRTMAKTPSAFIRVTLNTGPFISPVLTRGIRSLIPLTKVAPPKPKGTAMATTLPAALPHLLNIKALLPTTMTPQQSFGPVGLTAPKPAPAPATSTSFLDKKIVGNVTVKDAGLGGAALAGLGLLWKHFHG